MPPRADDAGDPEEGSEAVEEQATGGKSKKPPSREIVIDQVLAVGDGADLRVGVPLVAGASVKATVVAQGKHDKVHIFKMRRRKHYRKSQGHRQAFTELQINAVTA